MEVEEEKKIWKRRLEPAGWFVVWTGRVLNEFWTMLGHKERQMTEPRDVAWRLLVQAWEIGQGNFPKSLCYSATTGKVLNCSKTSSTDKWSKPPSHSAAENITSEWASYPLLRTGT